MAARGGQSRRVASAAAGQRSGGLKRGEVPRNSLEFRRNTRSGPVLPGPYVPVPRAHWPDRRCSLPITVTNGAANFAALMLLTNGASKRRRRAHRSGGIIFVSPSASAQQQSRLTAGLFVAFVAAVSSVVVVPLSVGLSVDFNQSRPTTSSTTSTPLTGSTVCPRGS